MREDSQQGRGFIHHPSYSKVSREMNLSLFDDLISANVVVAVDKIRREFYKFKARRAASAVIWRGNLTSVRAATNNLSHSRGRLISSLQGS